MEKLLADCRLGGDTTRSDGTARVSISAKPDANNVQRATRDALRIVSIVRQWVGNARAVETSVDLMTGAVGRRPRARRGLDAVSAT
jgi:hypothetical protein